MRFETLSQIPSRCFLTIKVVANFKCYLPGLAGDWTHRDLLDKPQVKSLDHRGRVKRTTTGYLIVTIINMQQVFLIEFFIRTKIGVMFPTLCNYVEAVNQKLGRKHREGIYFVKFCQFKYLLGKILSQITLRRRKKNHNYNFG